MSITGKCSGRIIGALTSLLVAGSAVVSQQTPPPNTSLQPRETFTVSLAKLSVALEETTKKVERVRISYEGSDDYINVGTINDEYVKMTRKGRETTVYREPWESAAYVSDFEGSQLRSVTETFIEALRTFEDDLQKERWPRLHYLDGFLPRFMRGFYYLCDAIVCGQEGLPRVARVPETAFDVSLVSPKTDERVAKWRAQPDHVIKLRIASKELAYQLERWAKANEADPQRFLDSDSKKAYSLFIRIYFNLAPQPKVPAEGEHL